MTPQEVEQYVLLASDASNIQHQQQANSLLLHWVSSSSENVLADTLLQVLKSTRREVVLFYCLTTFQRLGAQTSVEQRVIFRQEVFSHLLNDSTSFWKPVYLRTKVGVLFAKFIQIDFPQSWPSAFQDLQSLELLRSAPDILLRTLVALMDDFGKDENPVNSRIKDVLRGYHSADHLQPQRNQQSIIEPYNSISGQLLKTILPILSKAMEETNGNLQYGLQIAVLCLTTLKGFMSWVDLSLLLDEQTLNLIFIALAKGGTRDSPMGDAGVAAVECLQELMGRGMEDNKKVELLLRTNALAVLHAHVNLEIVDASPIDVVLEVAKFINRTGLEVLPLLAGQEHTIYSQLLDLFFRCFAYDDIDVSGAVVPLAGSLISLQGQEQEKDRALFSQLLTVTYRQMRYPADFQYDYEDDDEAEEEIYRTELRKLNQKFIRADPEICLQFTCQSLALLPVPLSNASTPEIEAALRLVYHYCEGIRPPPGLKVVMRNETFCNLLVGLHASDIACHQHQEVLTLYYEIAVRYYPLLKEKPDLLQKVLTSLTGSQGLQHENSRVRSRCCYLLLRLIKTVGNSNTTNSVLRPYVETAIIGIMSLVENNSVHLRLDDKLNLFETIGLLLGKTGLEVIEQQKYLTQVMTPHVHSINRLLEQEEALKLDPELHGESLAGSIAAVAFLSKGFKKPAYEIQMVLVEALNVSLAVLKALPNIELVRNKSYILVQRLIQCIEDMVLPCMPDILFLLITNCTTEDILDLAQLFNQLCIKFKTRAVPAMDAALLPFLQKCHSLSTISTSEAPSNGVAIAPHLRIEQLSIQKLNYTVLQHIAMHEADSILFSPTNVSSLEHILQSMKDGAVHVEDPLMKKTCLVFFKDLLSKWVVSLGKGKEQTATDPPSFVVDGYIRFLIDGLIPSVMLSFFKESFNCKDANQWRSVSEVACIFELLQKGLPEVYYQEILVGKLSAELGCPAPTVEAFRHAVNRKQIEGCLKNMIQQHQVKVNS